MFVLERAVPGIVFLAGMLLGYPAEVQAQQSTACTPVVYVFRHAEDHGGLDDVGPPWGLLTWIGQRHAQLYPDMVADFAATSGHCPLTRVYASSPSLTGQNQINGATNAFCTARPLAQLGTVDSQKQEHHLILTVSGKLFCSITPSFPPILRPDNQPALTRADTDPIIYLCGTPDEPSQNCQNNPAQLDEYLGAGKGKDDFGRQGPNPTSDIATLLRSKLKKDAAAGESSAIFWTSQGLYTLGTAILDAPSRIPQKYRDQFFDYNWDYEPIYWETPPRNAAYVFEYSNGTFTESTTTFAQAFNFKSTKQQFCTTMQPSDSSKIGGNICENASQCTPPLIPSSMTEGNCEYPKGCLLRLSGSIISCDGVNENGIASCLRAATCDLPN